MTNVITPELKNTVSQLTAAFDAIAPARKEDLRKLTSFIQSRMKTGENIDLNFICTHNSRRSHIAQLWAQVAAYVYAIPNVTCFSGGTEATAFHPNAVEAMRQAGFKIDKMNATTNPSYRVTYADQVPPVVTFSKKFDDPANPAAHFAAIMVCTHADEHCPFIEGATFRLALPYEDPKQSDGSPQQAETYLERVHEIGRDMLFVFSQASK
jgi:arsenate reductase